MGKEWVRPGGESAESFDFSESLVLLMIFLITSFCFFRWSLLLHHSGLLYSHFSPRCLHALQHGFPSSHFFLRSRQVKQPDRVSVVPESYTLARQLPKLPYLNVISCASWLQRRQHQQPPWRHQECWRFVWAESILAPPQGRPC